MKVKILESLCCLLAVFLVFSCSRGVDDDEQFSAGVTNAQLESPVIDGTSFSNMTGTDGSENVKVEWPVVNGAGGYLFNVSIVDDPANPVAVIKDSIVDGCSVVFSKLEDTRYEVSVKSLSNAQLNNKEAAAATVYDYSTLVPATVIPEGSEISDYVKANLKSSNDEQGFELLAGKTYYLNGVADFGLNTVTFRGDKSNRPTVIVGADGGLMTQGGLKVKFLNFDCTAMTTQIGVLSLSENPDESISTESLGYKANGANQDGYVINKPVIFQDCNFKNVPNSLIYGSKNNWSLRDFRIMNCIVQLKNSGSNSVLNLYGAKNGCFKSLTIKNSTFYNLETNSSGYFMRNSNASNGQPKKIFGNNDSDGTVLIENNTFCRTMTNKDFGNNMVNTNTITTTVRNNIFYDVFRLYQGFATQGVRTYAGNTICGISATVNSNDNGGRKDSNGNALASEEDPQFAGPFDTEFDLTQAKGGVNFKPSAPMATGNKSGDPRWYE